MIDFNLITLDFLLAHYVIKITGHIVLLLTCGTPIRLTRNSDELEMMYFPVWLTARDTTVTLAGSWICEETF